MQRGRRVDEKMPETCVMEGRLKHYLIKKLEKERGQEADYR